jgi:hypothetical protein
VRPGATWYVNLVVGNPDCPTIGDIPNQTADRQNRILTKVIGSHPETNGEMGIYFPAAEKHHRRVKRIPGNMIARVVHTRGCVGFPTERIGQRRTDSKLSGNFVSEIAPLLIETNPTLEYDPQL